MDWPFADLLANTPRDDTEFVQDVLVFGTPEQVEEIHNNGFSIEIKYIMNEIPIDNMKKLVSLSASMSYLIVNHFIEAQNFETLGSILNAQDHFTNSNFETALVNAPNWETFEFILNHPNNPLGDEVTLDIAVFDTSEPNFYFKLLERGLIPTQVTLRTSFYRERLDVINDLLSRRFIVDNDCFLNAIIPGNIDLIKICLNRGVGSAELGLKHSWKVSVIEFFVSLIDGPIDWEQILENVGPDNSEAINYYLSKIEEPTKALNSVCKVFKTYFPPRSSKNNELYSLLEKRIIWSRIPGEYKFRFGRTFAKVKRNRRLLEKYGWKIRDRWLAKSADPNGNGVFYRNWKVKMLQILENH